MVKRKKILYLITKSVRGGAGKYVFELASHTQQARFEITVAAGGRGALVEKLSEKNIAYFEIKGLGRDVKVLSDLFAFFQIIKLLFAFKPDILHASSPKAAGLGGFAFFIYKFLTFRFYARSIYTIHGWVFNEPRSGWQKFILRNASRIICLFYNRIIVLAQSEYEIAKRLWILPAHKMIIIHNGIDPKSIHFFNTEEAQRKLAEIYNISIDQHTVIGTIGELTKNKGYSYLLEAFAILRSKDLRFKSLIIAWGEEGEKLKIQRKKFGLENYVVFIENLSPASPYIKAFDIFVLPSLKEGLPYTLLEAGLAELPVIATAVGGNSDIIEHEKTGLLVPPANPKALAESLERLLSDVGLRQKFARNLHEKILREFSQQEMLEKTFALYEEVANSRKKTNS